MKILIVEDELQLAKSIQQYLQKENYLCEVASDITTGRQMIEDFNYDCILLDISLPEGSGLTLQNILFLVLSGIATGLSWIFYFKALSIGKVSQVAPVDKLSVALAILLSILFLGETPDWKTLAGAALIIGGTFVLIL